MGAGVILDTSFLITLANPDRPNYAVARKYWQYFMDQETFAEHLHESYARCDSPLEQGSVWNQVLNNTVRT